MKMSRLNVYGKQIKCQHYQQMDKKIEVYDKYMKYYVYFFQGQAVQLT